MNMKRLITTVLIWLVYTGRGKTYVIKQKQLSFGGCSAEIIDSSSGVPPTDIKIYNANDMCTLY